MSLLLQHHDIGNYLPSDDFPYPFFVDAKKRTKANELMHGLISRHLLARVPDCDKWNESRLFTLLKTLNRPFRFLDLPPELREQVFLFAFPRTFEPVEACHRYPETTYPATLRVSSLIRREALPLFYSRTEIMFDMTYTEEENRRIGKWAEEVAGDNLKWIQHISMALQSAMQELDCTWTKEQGFKIKFAFCKPKVDAVERSLRDHIDATDQCFKSLRIQDGSALLLFVLRDLSVWGRIAREWEAVGHRNPNEDLTLVWTTVMYSQVSAEGGEIADRV